MNRLTDVDYWEENWWKGQRARRLWLYRDFDFETVRLLHEAAGSPRCRVLEIGAGGSRVLPYIGQKFGHEVFGTDFSWGGCRLLRANLALVGVQGGVVCEDLFQSSLGAETFDLVYSSGLIEHFEDTRSVIAEHLRLVKPGGRLVLIVPNFQGVQGKIVKKLAPPLWKVHQIFGPGDLGAILKSLGLEQIRSEYLGSFYIHIGRGHEWPAIHGWPPFLQLLLHASVRLLNALISLAFRLSPVRPHSQALSPAFFAVGTKPKVEPPAAMPETYSLEGECWIRQGSLSRVRKHDGTCPTETESDRA